MTPRFLLLLLLAASTASTAHATTIELSEFRGRVLYLDFWASWCTPCQQSFPWMDSIKAAHESEGLTVVAVNLDEHRSDADRFLGKMHPTFDVRFDPQAETAKHFQIHGMPTSLIIDRRGVVRFTHLGFKPVDRNLFEQQLRQVLAEK